MMLFIKTHLWKIIFLSVCLQLYVFSLLIVKNDTGFTYRWLAFWLHIVAVLSVVAFYFKQNIHIQHLHKSYKEKEILAFGIILIIVEIISLLFITDYPFISIGDEVRDGGLNAMQIANGTIKNIFAYGRYGAHGLIIPTITSFFYHIFGSSVLTYRLPAALLACLDVAVVFILVRLLINRTTAFFSALVLATMPLHMFFARTQVVVAFNSFLSSIILFSLSFFLKRQRTIDYVFLGTVLGFVFGFHAAIRVVAILVLLVAITISLWEITAQLLKKKHNIQVALLNLLLLIIFSFVGFGPRLLFTNTTNFFHTSRLTVRQNTDSNFLLTLNDVETIKGNYLKSLMVWFYEPTTFTFPDHKPIFPPFLAIFFILGIGYSLFILKKPFLYILIYLGATVPLLSSAITDLINADHRLSPLMPVGSIFVGIGIYYVFTLIRYKYARYALGVFIAGYLLFQVNAFFTNRPADKNYDIKDFLSMNVIQFAKSQEPVLKGAYASSGIPSKSICLVVSPANYTNLNLLHYQEQYQYFLPNTVEQTKSDTNINDNEAYVFNGSCPNDYTSATKQNTVSCTASQNKYSCPLNFTGDIAIHY